jgi:hypothetical protein
MPMTLGDAMRNQFRMQWEALAAEGKVDAIGSAQYMRAQYAFDGMLPGQFVERWLSAFLSRESAAPAKHAHGKHKKDE